MHSGLLASWSIVLLLLGAGCSTRGPLACPEAQASGRTAKVFFATDRRQQPSGSELRFGRERTDPPGLNMGWERVTLGPKHELGKVDQAVAITPAKEQTESSQGTRSDALQRTDAEIRAFVNAKLRPAIRASRPAAAGEPRKVLLFVHGYNTTYTDAVRKTAQLAGDLEFVGCAGESRGVPIAYSWPAQGTLLSYLADEENAEWTQQRLAPFIHALAEACRQEGAELTLIGHSMGTRALVRSLADLSNVGSETRKLADNVVLLAPDIGQALFEQYVERFLPMVGHLTIYVSAKDRALSLSSLLHGGRRLGLIESTVLAALEFTGGLTGLRRDDHRQIAARSEAFTEGKMDMIDVSGSFSTQFGHSYEDPEFITDLRELIWHNTPAGTGNRSILERRKTGRSIFSGAAANNLSYFQLKMK